MKKSISELLSSKLNRSAVCRELGINRGTVKRWQTKFNPLPVTEKRIRVLLEQTEATVQTFAKNDRITHHLLGAGRVSEVGTGVYDAHCRCIFDSGKWGWIMNKCLKKEK